MLEYSVSAAEADDHEDVHEEVDDVQVDVEGGEDVLLGAQAVLVLPTHHQLAEGRGVYTRYGRNDTSEDGHAGT